MKSPLFTGTCTALVTPFLNGEVNYPMLEQLILRQIHAGIKVIVVCGTTGEASTLSDAEKIRIFTVAANIANGKAKIIAGTGSNATAHCVSLSIAAEKCGVDGILVVSPYYNKATSDGLTAHYTAVANSVKIPVILYNVPSRTGLDVPVSVYRALSSLPNIVGVKEANNDLSKILKIRSECPSDFCIWSGNDETAVPFISIGAQGVISVVSNLYPALVQAMMQAALDGDFDTAAALQTELYPLTQVLFSQVNPIPVKAAMKLLGFDCGGCRLPLTNATPDLLNRLNQALIN